MLVSLVTAVPAATAAAQATSWRDATPAISPPQRVGGALADFPPTDTAVLFGGYDGSNGFVPAMYSDTWIWDGSQWSERDVSPNPGPRGFASMAYDPSIHRAVLFGGETVTGTYFGDTWTWDGSAWRDGPGGPPARVNAAMAYDDATGQMILFGGAGEVGNLNDALLNDTWEWNGSSWTQLFPETSPSPRALESLAYDPATHQLLLYGGTQDPSGASGETWLWTGTDWQKVIPANSPPPIAAAGMAYDSRVGDLVLYGGSINNNQLSSDTWIWDGSTWSEAAPIANPGETSLAAMTTDPSSGEPLQFGGYVGNGFDSARTWLFGPADDTPPVVTASLAPAPNPAGWFNSPPTITWSASDPDNATSELTVPSPTVASTEGKDVTYTSGPACDPTGNCATGSATVSLDVTPPTAGVPTLGTNPVSVTQSTSISSPVSDALSGGAGAEYFVGSDPGIGQGSPMTVSAGTATATMSAGSLTPGVYTIGVRSQDAAGNWSATASSLLVVYNPNGGYATGGGWIVPGGNTSDPGDVLPGLDGASKANFGFVVQYKNGSSTVPGGNLEFDYNVGNLHLHSTAMEWLVVTNQNMAQFQGTATIQGSTQSYPFSVQARDGDPTGQTDRFSIKIYPAGSDPSTATPMYKASGDVQGQITIHKS